MSARAIEGTYDNKLLHGAVVVVLCCAVSSNYAVEAAEFVDAPQLSGTFSLPDGSLITVGRPQIEVPELLFNPSMAPPEFWKTIGRGTDTPKSLAVRATHGART